MLSKIMSFMMALVVATIGFGSVYPLLAQTETECYEYYKKHDNPNGPGYSCYDTGDTCRISVDCPC
jgi:hypothetical protein